ncbi:MAG TPA: hypothetical protein VF503_27610 [Sphingobium sp.]|uniref:hypothetical protein n=1 Tax=Sphingobium sp. TaxID=1912891 RepID=UPI002ED099F5
MNNKTIKYFLVYLFFVSINIQSCFAKYPVYSRNYYTSIIKKEDNYTPISNNTVIIPVYDDGAFNIVHYSNVNDETNHGQARIFLFKNAHLKYSYQADDTTSCFIHHADIRCPCSVLGDIQPYSDIRISDLIAGKKVLVCGDLSEGFPAHPPPRPSRRKRR